MALRLEIRALDGELLDGASALLAARHARHLASEPLLPEAGDVRARLEQELARDGASGAAALRGRAVVGFLVGTPAGRDRIEVGLAGHAVTEPEIARDLYAALAGGWVDGGRPRHAVYVPAHDTALVDAWFRLAFGLQFAFAVREVEPEPPFAGGVEIRPGTPADVAVSAALERSLWEHQLGSPSFSGMDIPALEAFADDWADTWTDPGFTHVVAERDGRVVGQALLHVRPTGDLRIPERAIDLAQMETLPGARGTGVGRALFAHVLGVAHDAGYAAITTDWRSVNLLASRFWPRRGFRPTFLRLYRAVP